MDMDTNTNEFAGAHDPIGEIRHLFERRGALAYGEAVTQLEHALQTAMLAERDGASPFLITAGLLHDIGHMLHEDAAAAMACGDDDRHEALAAHRLAPWFPDDVVAPIALHVAAKRYLAAIDPHYVQRLSPVSIATMEMQGGPMSRTEASAFARHPYSVAAVRLRRYDEAAKVPGEPTPPLVRYLAIAAACCRVRLAK